MTLETLLEDRYRWQNCTIENIEKQLLCKPEGFHGSEISGDDQGNALKDTIAALCTYTAGYAEQQTAIIEQKIQDIEKQITSAEVEIKQKERQVLDCECELAKNKDAVGEYRFVRDTDINFSIREYKNKFIKYIDNYISGNMQDANKKLPGICENQIKQYISGALTHKLSEYVCMESCEELYKSIISDIPIDVELEKILYPTGWIHMFDKVYRIKCIFVIEDYFTRIEKKVNGIFKAKKMEYLKQNRSVKDEYDQYSQLRKECKRDIEQCKSRIAGLTDELQCMIEAKSALEANLEKDNECLLNYVEVSVEEFEKQKNQLLNQLMELSSGEKVSVLLFIALLEKDFNNMFGRGVVC